MTDERSIERVLDQWFASGPAELPDRVIDVVATEIERVGQRPAWRLLRRPVMNSYPKVAAAVAAVIVIAIAGWNLWPGPSAGPGANPTPPVSPSPPAVSPTATPSATSGSGYAADFVRPFGYVLPDGPEFEFGPSSATYFEVRVPEWFEAGHPGGLIVQAITGRHVDPCDPTSKVLPMVNGSMSVFDYLRTVPGVSVTNETGVTVDSSFARQATVVATPEADCPEIWAWTESAEPFIAGPVLRLVTTTVSERSIIVTVFGEPENPTWPDLADDIIASFRFQHAPPFPS